MFAKELSSRARQNNAYLIEEMMALGAVEIFANNVGGHGAKTIDAFFRKKD